MWKKNKTKEEKKGENREKKQKPVYKTANAYLIFVFFMSVRKMSSNAIVWSSRKINKMNVKFWQRQKSKNNNIKKHANIYTFFLPVQI